MTINSIKKVFWLIFVFLASVGFRSAYAAGEGEVPDVSYMTRHVQTPGFFDLMPHGHKLSKDLVGKELIVLSGGMELIKCQFVDDTTIKWWFPIRPDVMMQNPYAAFEIAEDIYMLTWVEDEHFAPPMDPSIDLSTWVPKWYIEDVSTTFVLDLRNNMITDAFMQADSMGNLQYNLVQADIVLQDIPEE